MPTRDPEDDRTRLREPAADETAVRSRELPLDGTMLRDGESPGDRTLLRGVEPAADGSQPRGYEPPADETFFRDPSLFSGDGALMPPATSFTATHASPPVARQGIPFGAGYKLRGRYLLDEQIGQGAMGTVWRAKDLLGEEARDRNPYVAVKVLNSDFHGRPDAFISLHREATRAQKLAHPNIATVYVFDRDEESGRAFIAMELLEGQPLDKLIRQSGHSGMAREQSLPIIRGMADGLAYAHRKGIVHSDFKPANVFILKDGTPKILDFGIARAVQLDGDDSGFQGYTVNYAAPEALEGAAPSTSEDVFSLGIVSYELVSGNHPFKRMSALEAKAANLPRPALRHLKRRECRAIEKALAYDPAQRFPDATAFLRQLQGIPVIQKTLVVAVGLLLVAAGILWYRNYLDAQPNEPLEQLPAPVQREFHAKVRLGNESLAYLKRANDITASADAAQYFADAYRLHEKDPEAVSGLETAADYAIAWYRKLPDQHEARAELEKFRAKSDYYEQYGPLQKAIRAAGGD